VPDTVFQQEVRSPRANGPWQAFGVPNLLLTACSLPFAPGHWAMRDVHRTAYQRENGMYHNIKFTTDCRLDLELSPKHRLEQTLIHRDIPLSARIKPYVQETADGPVEVADLFFADGTATRQVRFACFCFVE
jgi:hypothetical protein